MQILVLRHPREPRQPDGTVPLIVDACNEAGLPVHIATGLSWANLAKALGSPAAQPGRYAVLFLGTGIELKRPRETDELYHVQKDKTLRPLQPGAGRDLDGIILLDGNWRQSKALWWRNAWLTRVNRIVLNPKTRSRYNVVRREPRNECLSTLEACALTLEILVPRNPWTPKLWTKFETFLETHQSHQLQRRQSDPRRSRAESSTSSLPASEQKPTSAP